MSKSALGNPASANQSVGEEKAGQALKLAQEAGKLLEAADLMEEAFNKWPAIRNRYEHLVKVWRRGLSL